METTRGGNYLLAWDQDRTVFLGQEKSLHFDSHSEFV